MAYEDGVLATIYDEAVKDKSASKNKGYPVFADSIYIKIQVPNQVDCVPRPLQEKDKTRFPKTWEAYVTGKEPAESGFPLDQWPQITTGEVKVCQANHIKTVEQLADTADSNIHRLGPGGSSMKNKAIKFLKERDGTDELRAKNDELAAKLELALTRIEALEGRAPDAEEVTPKRKRLKVAK